MKHKTPNLPFFLRITCVFLLIFALGAVFDVARVSELSDALARISNKGHLTREGVLKWTNVQREEEKNLPPLIGQTKLDEIAQRRLKDMFAKQYFEHVSPSGDDAAKEAKRVGFEYILIGENLALGDYTSDQSLVQSWMDSPGHRANILNTHYTQLGIAVGRGVFKGREQWIGVQIFALPRSACPRPDATLSIKIKDAQKKLATLKNTLSKKKQALEKMETSTNAQRDAYNKQLTEYNALVRQINSLVGKIKGWTSTYNQQIAKTNACISRASKKQ